MEKGQTSMHTQREKEFNWDEVEKIRTRKKKEPQILMGFNLELIP